jgi:hypothetical protein
MHTLAGGLVDLVQLEGHPFIVLCPTKKQVVEGLRPTEGRLVPLNP